MSSKGWRRGVSRTRGNYRRLATFCARPAFWPMVCRAQNLTMALHAITLFGGLTMRRCAPPFCSGSSFSISWRSWRPGAVRQQWHCLLPTSVTWDWEILLRLGCCDMRSIIRDRSISGILHLGVRVRSSKGSRRSTRQSGTCATSEPARQGRAAFSAGWPAGKRHVLPGISNWRKNSLAFGTTVLVLASARNAPAANSTPSG